MLPRLGSLGAIVALFLAWACLVLANDMEVGVYVPSLTGKPLPVNRYPALYTGDFADCLPGGSMFEISKFDAAYYTDNLTVLFHIDGTTKIQREELMLIITVSAYGEERFTMNFDPCKANIYSMCPLNASIPIEGFVVVPLAPYMADGIPSIALGIPDLEAYARISIFSNTTKEEIGCYQAVMTNGNSMGQPEGAGGFLAFVVLLAFLASFATAIYGVQIPSMRNHYANSFSVLVVFETFQSMFYSGALNVDWPSILPAWWSNFAWTAGVYAPPDMVRALGAFTGNNDNFTQPHGSTSATLDNSGELSQQIYGRALSLVKRAFGGLKPRDNPTNYYDYQWAGFPQTPGLPMPGTWPGFSGTLSKMHVPASEVFMVGIIWLCLILILLAIFVVSAKLVLDYMAKKKWLKDDGFDYFRSHVRGYLTVILSRTVFLYFFSTMTLVMHQLSYGGAPGPIVIAVIVGLVFFVGLGGTAAYACYLRLQHDKFEIKWDALRLESGTIFKRMPFVALVWDSEMGEKEVAHKPRVFATVPFLRVEYTPNNPYAPKAHEDEEYIKRFGWLSARYRSSRWWFFAYYLAYQFVRAALVGGGARTPMAQVYGLFIFEILAFYVIVKIKPFEGARNTAVAVWMLSISKVVTAGVSIGFLPVWKLNRILATVLAFIIVIAQGFLAAAVLVLMILGIISSWMSVTRNTEKFPDILEPLRVTYFEHIAERSQDLQPGRKPKKPKKPRRRRKPMRPPPARQSSFSIREVRRISKIGDEDEDVLAEATVQNTTKGQPADFNPRPRHSRANSASSRFSTSSLPRAARVHRASWSSKDFAQWDAEMGRNEQQRISWARSELVRSPSATQEPELNSRRTSIRRPMTPANEAYEDILNSRISEEKTDKSKDKRQPVVSEKELKSPTLNPFDTEESASDSPVDEDKNSRTLRKSLG